MQRSPAQNKAAHALLGDFALSWSHEGVHLTAADWKLVACCYFHFALCEADGLEVRDIPLPESTSKMDVDRMNNFLEWLLFIGAQMGVSFTE
jgi:hypothetical protein